MPNVAQRQTQGLCGAVNGLLVLWGGSVIRHYHLKASAILRRQALQHGRPLAALAILTLSLVGGLLLTTLGYELALRCRRSGSRS